jgi:hypothetical protein
MDRLLLGIIITIVLAATGCEPDSEHYHAQMLGGNLRTVYYSWTRNGRPQSVEPTNYLFSISSVSGTKYQVFVFTNQLRVDGVSYHCRFAIREPNLFRSPGVLAITDEEVLFWIADDGKIDKSPDSNRRWSSTKAQRRKGVQP